MRVIEETLAANRKYAETFEHGHLPMPPARKRAVPACQTGQRAGVRFLYFRKGAAIVEAALPVVGIARN